MAKEAYERRDEGTTAPVLRASVLTAIAAVLVVCSVAGGGNVAVLFSGGLDRYRNHDRYHQQVLQMYGLLIGPLGFAAEDVIVLSADGLDPGVDRPDGSSTDYGLITSAGSAVLPATGAELSNALSGLELDSADLLYFWVYDHGDGVAGESQTVGEEVLYGWGEEIADEELAGWLLGLSPGRSAYVFSQCFAGGMLDDLAIEPGSGRFGAAASGHDEFSYWDYFADAWAGGFAEGGRTRTHDVFAWAVEHDPAAGDGTGPGGYTYTYGIEHPWMVGDDLDLAVARWRGVGAGGSMVLWSTRDNWSAAPTAERTVQMEMDQAGEVVIDSPGCEAGYLTLDGPSGAESATLNIVVGGELTSRFQTFGDRATGLLRQRGGRNGVEQDLLLGDRPGSDGRGEMSAGDARAGRLILGRRGSGQWRQTGGSLQAGTLVLGEQDGSSGSLVLSGGEVSVTRAAFGVGGRAEVVIDGGQLATDEAAIGATAGGEGTVRLAGGRWSAGDVTVGGGGAGELIWSGGDLTAEVLIVDQRGRLDVHRDWAMDRHLRVTGGRVDVSGSGLTVGSAGDGRVDVTSGALSAGRLILGGRGTGDLMQSGGRLEVARDVTLGSGQNGLGRYEVSAGELRTASLHVGRQGEGQLHQSGGSVFVEDQAVLGTFGGAVGRYELDGGEVSAGRLRVGFWGRGELALSAGQVRAEDLSLYADGRLEMTGGGIHVSDRLEAQRGAELVVSEGEIRLDSAAWITRENAPADWDLRGLTLTTSGDCDIEVFAADEGNVDSSADGRLWLDRLIVGDGQAGTLVLRDQWGADAGPAALYVRELAILPGSIMLSEGPVVYLATEGRMARLWGKMEGNLTCWTAETLDNWRVSGAGAGSMASPTSAVPEPSIALMLPLLWLTSIRLGRRTRWTDRVGRGGAKDGRASRR